ncbi:MAG: hypothetical protein K6G33_10665 [Ruminococcus sp.]|uniref:hypothetical protein n=1 Tax=Ruminococcus sp. TaxID=41978 RepID=UPI0025D92DFF|nr:hypothetical protein [Ruminococcus sp.]MCR5601187.1 hypothetical protein [Ruminococcus sp.]
MKRNEVNLMLNGIDDKFINEAAQEGTVAKSVGRGRKIGMIGSLAACLCLIAGTVYLTGKPNRTLNQYGVSLSHNGVNMYYEQEELIRIKDFMLNNEKGEKIEEFSNDEVSWYKLKDSDNIKTIICDDGNDITEWKFVSYSFDETEPSDISWIIENVFSIGSKDDIKNAAINGEVRELDEGQKEKLYNYLLALTYPRSDEEMSLMEEMSVNYSELTKFDINTKNGTLNFIIDTKNNILKLDEGAYSLFTVMTDDEFINME